jgi:hypothetical protein
MAFAQNTVLYGYLIMDSNAEGNSEGKCRFSGEIRSFFALSRIIRAVVDGPLAEVYSGIACGSFDGPFAMCEMPA